MFAGPSQPNRDAIRRAATTDEERRSAEDELCRWTDTIVVTEWPAERTLEAMAMAARGACDAMLIVAPVLERPAGSAADNANPPGRAVPTSAATQASTEASAEDERAAEPTDMEIYYGLAWTIIALECVPDAVPVVVLATAAPGRLPARWGTCRPAESQQLPSEGDDGFGLSEGDLRQVYDVIRAALPGGDADLPPDEGLDAFLARIGLMPALRATSAGSRESADAFRLLAQQSLSAWESNPMTSARRSRWAAEDAVRRAGAVAAALAVVVAAAGVGVLLRYTRLGTWVRDAVSSAVSAVRDAVGTALGSGSSSGSGSGGGPETPSGGGDEVALPAEHITDAAAASGRVVAASSAASPSDSLVSLLSLVSSGGSATDTGAAVSACVGDASALDGGLFDRA